MSRRTALCGALLLAVVLPGCRSSIPAGPEDSSPHRVASLGAPTDLDRSEPGEWRRTVEDSVELAAEAALLGDEAEFDDCEEVILAAVASAALAGPGDAAFVSDALEELQRLREELASNLETENGAQELVVEGPPEPGPVAAAEVEQTIAQAKEESFDLPVVINEHVTSLIAYYTGPYRERLILAMDRGALYVPYIRERLRASRLPEDLAYLPLVESAFNTKARSRARAQGMWQFMKGTAALYGLRCDGLVDERNDPYLATDAAVAHLADLFAEFGNWELALAAYNSGAGRVNRALRRARNTRDFWEIRRYLPRETRNYVPAFWAALVVAKNPGAYALPPWQERSQCLARVPVSGALDLDVLAETVSVEVATLAEVNPALIHGMTPPQGTYRLAVPCGQEEATAAAIASIPPDKRVRRFFHTVQRGDTLSVIARRYGSSVQTITAANGIRDPRRLKIGQKLVIPRSPGATTVVAESRPERYVVRRGDTLYKIARRYGTSVEAIQRRNDLGSSVIRPGDVLLLP